MKLDQGENSTQSTSGVAATLLGQKYAGVWKPFAATDALFNETINVQLRELGSRLGVLTKPM